MQPLKLMKTSFTFFLRINGESGAHTVVAEKDSVFTILVKYRILITFMLVKFNKIGLTDVFETF